MRFSGRLSNNRDTRSAKSGIPCNKPLLTRLSLVILAHKTLKSERQSPNGCSPVSKKKIVTPSCQASIRCQSWNAVPHDFDVLVPASGALFDVRTLWWPEPMLWAASSFWPPACVPPASTTRWTSGGYHANHASFFSSLVHPAASRPNVFTLPRKSPTRKVPFAPNTAEAGESVECAISCKWRTRMLSTSCDAQPEARYCNGQKVATSSKMGPCQRRTESLMMEILAGKASAVVATVLRSMYAFALSAQCDIQRFNSLTTCAACSMSPRPTASTLTRQGNSFRPSRPPVAAPLVPPVSTTPRLMVPSTRAAPAPMSVLPNWGKFSNDTFKSRISPTNHQRSSLAFTFGAGVGTKTAGGEIGAGVSDSALMALRRRRVRRGGVSGGSSTTGGRAISPLAPKPALPVPPMAAEDAEG
mmetsp:Transcript_101041/g.290801  ORF Transcript_101041/g.290801 Transcript_101041/m.290801 type:complete len:415 (+) Transcript_101041:1630-2874(+)